MHVELRPVAEDEVEAFLTACHAGFGQGPPAEAGMALRVRAVERDRTLAAFEGGRIVGTSGAFSFQLTLPGLTTVPVAGVTGVAVLPTHRRRGLLTRMMAGVLDQARERGEPAAVLLASEGVIYGRFGFGVATHQVAVEVERRHGAMLRPDPPAGRVRLLDRAEAAKVLPPVLDRSRLARPGDLDRTAVMWDNLLRDPEDDRDGAGAAFFAVRETPAGEADGYAIYRVRSAWDHGSPRKRVQADEVVSLSPDAESALWRFLLAIDLTEVVEAPSRPLDDPLRWLLADPRRLRVTRVTDFLWARLLDVPAALAARRYDVPGRLVLDVVDPAHPDVAGRWAVEGGPDGATCAPTAHDPDLALGAAELASVWLGGVRPSSLAAAGRVAEVRPGALARADAMLACRPSPFCSVDF